MIDVGYLRARLRYEPETGKLYWRRHAAMPDWWNTRWAGREAFTAACRYGYRVGAIDGRSYRAHRVAWAITHGTWPKGQLDHEDRDRSNNRIGNLRAANQQANMQNSSKRRDNSSGANGVYWHKPSGRWQARIKMNGKAKHLGLFDSFEDAVAARKRADATYGFSPGHGSDREIAGGVG